MIETVVGNFLVILSVKVEKKLQTPFNYYIVNLAFTDMNVGMSVMSLFLIYNLYEYFPFNDYLCNYWIWSDYTMTFESVMTLAAISIDRFWSVTWTLHYRNHNSGRKSLYIILMTWVIVSCIWLPAFIYDRIVHDYAPGDCFWDSEKNKKLVLYVGFLGYYSPLFIMLGAYTRIFYVMKKRAAQVKAQTKRSEVTAISAWFPTFFPSWYINFSYWMAYINSAVNPVLYPLSSAEFRSAYKKIFKMAMCQK
ncbi:muscarinic acetylcholine receptor M4-like isoform X2 [Oratosquilla oratoria]|uniref:muscarinic acetylcholine receptor M4-like isoform X2 n=1 Tax=Oratosquilla oratoria TaxID=337810 RepID=UPI003F76D135